MSVIHTCWGGDISAQNSLAASQSMPQVDKSAHSNKQRDRNSLGGDTPEFPFNFNEDHMFYLKCTDKGKNCHFETIQAKDSPVASNEDYENKTKCFNGGKECRYDLAHGKPSPAHPTHASGGSHHQARPGAENPEPSHRPPSTNTSLPSPTIGLQIIDNMNQNTTPDLLDSAEDLPALVPPKSFKEGRYKHGNVTYSGRCIVDKNGERKCHFDVFEQGGSIASQANGMRPFGGLLNRGKPASKSSKETGDYQHYSEDANYTYLQQCKDEGRSCSWQIKAKSSGNTSTAFGFLGHTQVGSEVAVIMTLLLLFIGLRTAITGSAI